MNKHINNFMHKVVVPLQYVLAVASLIIREVYNVLDKVVKMTIGYVMEVAKIVDEALRVIGTGIQRANQIMKQALLKDYTKKEDE